MFRHRHDSGGQGQGEGALDRAQVEAHTLDVYFRFHGMKNNHAWRFALARVVVKSMDPL